MEAMKYSSLKNVPQDQMEMIQTLEVVFPVFATWGQWTYPQFLSLRKWDIYFIDLLGRLTEVLAMKEPESDIQ